MSITKFCRLFRCNYLGHEAEIPRTDARGFIGSHWARSTIASQLFNAREPTTLFELQALPGHPPQRALRIYQSNKARSGVQGRRLFFPQCARHRGIGRQAGHRARESNHQKWLFSPSSGANNSFQLNFLRKW